MNRKVRVMDEASGDSPPPVDGGAVTPPAPPSEPAPKDDEGGSDLFSELATQNDDGEAPTPPPVTEPAPATPPVEPAPPKAEPPKVEPAPAPAPTSEPKPAAEPPPPTEEQRKEQYAKDRAAALARLMERYVVPEDKAPTLVTEPEKVLPEMLANLHANVMEHMAAYMQQALPQLLQAANAQDMARKQAAEKFFSEWPELNKPDYHPTVARVLAGYRQANPEAKAEDVVREGGVAAMLALRLPLPERVMKLHNVNAPDATQPAGFTPIAGTGAARVGPQKKEENLFAIIAQEDVVDGG